MSCIESTLAQLLFYMNTSAYHLGLSVSSSKEFRGSALYLTEVNIYLSLSLISI